MNDHTGAVLVGAGGDCPLCYKAEPRLHRIVPVVLAETGEAAVLNVTGKTLLGLDLIAKRMAAQKRLDEAIAEKRAKLRRLLTRRKLGG